MALTIDPNYFDLDEQGSSPATPDTNVVRIYVKSDGKFYRKDDTGVEVEIGNVTEFTTATFLEGSTPSTPASGKIALYGLTNGLLYSIDDAGVQSLVSGAMQPLASGSLAGISSLNISGIPTTYTSLRLMVIARTTNASEEFIALQVGNGSIDSTAANYLRSCFELINTTITGFSDNATANLLYRTGLGASGGGNLFATTIIDFPYYAGAEHKNIHYTHKSSTSSATSTQKVIIGAGTWRGAPNAINIINLSASSNFATNSSYALWGIR